MDPISTYCDGTGWFAYRGDDMPDPEGTYGIGRTEADAIAALLSIESRA